MDELSQLLSGALPGSGAAGTAATGGVAAAGGLGGLLGGLLGGAATSGATTSGGTVSGLGAVPSTGAGGLAGLMAVLPTLLPALLGLLGGATASGSTGLHELVSQLESQGAGHLTQSWIGNGPNLAVSAQQVEQALGAANVSQLAAQTGLSTGQVTQGVAGILPMLVHGLTPNGQMPAPAAVQQALGGLLGQR